MRVPRHRSVLLGLAAVFVLGGGVVAYAASGSGSADDPPVRSVQIAPADGPVKASDYWAAALAATDCASGLGANVLGPVPAPDGRSVTYSIQVTEDSRAIEATCMADLEPLAFRFGVDNGTQERPVPGDDGSEPPRQRPLTAEAETLVEIRSAIAGCLIDKGVASDDSDRAVAKAMHDDPAVFSACAAAA